MTNGLDYVEGSTVTRFYGENDTRREHENEPLTKREYFAAMALTGLCQNAGLRGFTHEQMAANAVEFADALIAELNK